MRHLNKTKIIDLLEELGVNTEPAENSKINAPKDYMDIPNPYGKPMLQVLLERVEKFNKSCDPGYRTMKELEEDEEYEKYGRAKWK